MQSRGRHCFGISYGLFGTLFGQPTLISWRPGPTVQIAQHQSLWLSAGCSLLTCVRSCFHNAGYSGSDLTQLGAHSACRCCTGGAGRSPLRTHSLSIGTQIAKDAALGPVRELGPRIRDAPAESLRPVSLADFASALNRVRPSVSSESLTAMETWSRKYGSFQGRRPRTGGKGNPVRVSAFILSLVMIAYLHLHRLMMSVKGMYKMYTRPPRLGRATGARGWRWRPQYSVNPQRPRRSRSSAASRRLRQSGCTRARPLAGCRDPRCLQAFRTGLGS